MKKYMLATLVLFLTGCFPALKTPGELATRYKCDPWLISGWMDGAIEYRVQSGYAPAATVMWRKWGDCKGAAVVAMETLQACGIKSHIVQLSQTDGPDHVITVFTLSDGHRGFINAGQSGVYPATTSWKEIISDIDNGKWSAVFAEEE